MALLKLNTKPVIQLYDYQQIAFDKVVDALKKTFRALMVMATGLGKTIVSIEVVKYFLTPKDKVLFLCHDNGILNKAYKDYKKYIGDQYTYTKFYGENKDWEADKHHFVFATFQSVLAHLRDKKVKEKLFSKKHFSFIVVDESHHSQAETFAEVINYFEPKLKLGMTATPDREDKADIRDIFGEEVVSILLPEAIANGWLTKVDYRVLSDGLDEEKIQMVCREVLEDNIRLTEKQINERIFIKVRTEEQCKIVQKFSKTQKAIIFCENIEHLQHVSSILPLSVSIHSEQSDKVNDSNFQLFEHGHVQHAIVVDKFNEGIDIPDTELLVFLRSTNSERIFLQQLGRGLRPAKGKEKVTVLDFVANINRIKQVSKLARMVERQTGEKRQSQAPATALHLEGKGFSFDFSGQIVNLLSAFEKLDQDFYPTWQEASRAVKKMGITRYSEYQNRYNEDPKLTSRPDEHYLDFPGWPIFFYGIEKYDTWQKCSKAARRLGIQSYTEYRDKQRYKEDPRLMSNPNERFKNFPGWPIFLGNCEKFKTYEEAKKAIEELGIKTRQEYKERYDEDPRLIKCPEKDYPDSSGLPTFLRMNYLTWQEASAAAIRLEIKNSWRYRHEHDKDPQLPFHPDKYYKDFPGWDKFLGVE